MSSAEHEPAPTPGNHLLEQQLAVAAEHFRAGNLDHVLTFLQEVETTSQPDARRKQLLAITYMTEGRWNEAWRCAQAVLQIDAGSIIARLIMARLKADRGLFEDAARQCKSALDTDPRHLVGWLMLAYYQERQGLVDLALDSYRKAVEIGPQIDILHHILASAYSKAGNHAAAKATAETALRLSPQVPQSRIALGDLYLGQGRLGEAEDEFREAARLQPNAQEPLRKLGEVLAEQGRHRAAVRAFNQSLELNLKAPFSLLAMGRSLLALQRPQKALQAFNKIFETMPAMPEAILGAARAELAMGKFRRAEKLFQKAMDIDPYLQSENRGIYGFSRHNHPVRSDMADLPLLQIQDEEPWVPTLLNALRNDSFVLRYQRIQPVDEKDKDKLHGEVLISLRDDTDNLILPEKFFPSAYHYHMMPLIDRWVVQSTLRFLHQNLAVLNHLGFFSINISDSTINDENFADFVISQMQRYQIAPYAICFEISETSATLNLWKAVRLMTQLKRLGCRFALGMAGNNRLSSVSYLNKLPVNYLKFDAGYIRNNQLDRVERTQVESITRASHDLRIKTIFEYVEDRRLVSELGEAGVDYLQGYAIAQPDLINTLTAAA